MRLDWLFLVVETTLTLPFLSELLKYLSFSLSLKERVFFIEDNCLSDEILQVIGNSINSFKFKWFIWTLASLGLLLYVGLSWFFSSISYATNDELEDFFF